MSRPQGVRDVPAEAFIKAYAAHLKSNDKVGPLVHPDRAKLHRGSCPGLTCLVAAHRRTRLFSG